MTKLDIPGYHPASAAEVGAAALQNIAQQQQFMLAFLESILRAILGESKEDIEKATGMRLMTAEEIADAKEGDGTGTADKGAGK